VDRHQVLEILASSKPVLTEQFGVTSLALFGSTARNTAREDSDIDILLSFDGPATPERYFGVQFFLEDAMGRPIDLVTEKALRKELRASVVRDAIRV
jgi:uncharacterized protein